MNVIRDLPWTWIAGGLAALAILAALLFPRRRRDPYGEHASRSGRGHGSSRGGSGWGSGSSSGSGTASGDDPAPGGGYGYAPPPGGEQRVLQAITEVRGALDRQAAQMAELRTYWSQRLDALDGKIGALDRARAEGGDAPGAGRGDPGQGFAGIQAPHDAALAGAGRPGRLPAGSELSWSPGPADQPVEIRDGVLVVSRSLPPVGYVSATGSGEARVYLNADVPLNEFSLPRWAAFFDLQGARTYARYRTRTPATVRWDDEAGRGELVSMGTAEAV